MADHDRVAPRPQEALGDPAGGLVLIAPSACGRHEPGGRGGGCVEIGTQIRFALDNGEVRRNRVAVQPYRLRSEQLRAPWISDLTTIGGLGEGARRLKRQGRRGATAGIALLAVVLGGVTFAQDHPDTIGRFGTDRHAWLAASHLDDVLDNLDPAYLDQIERQIADFNHRFGSTEEQGLAENSYSSSSFCAAPRFPGITSGHGGIMETTSIDGTLLLAEVAVIATVTKIIPGFSALGGPTVLLELSDTAPLTNRSPVPEYSLVPLKSMVINGSVFCHHGRDGFDYRPQVGDRLVLIGPWTKSAVTFGAVTTSLLGKLNGDDGPEWHTWNVAPWPNDFDDLVEHIAALESKGLLSATAHIASQRYGTDDRGEIGSAIGLSRCPVTGLNETTDGRLIPELSCDETDQ